MSNSSPERNKAIVLEAFETLFNKRDYLAAPLFQPRDIVGQFRRGCDDSLFFGMGIGSSVSAAAGRPVLGQHHALVFGFGNPPVRH